jgi:hypothetical protein
MDNQKIVSFEKDGVYNKKQFDYFNALFNTDLMVKSDYSELGYFGGFRCAKSFSQQAALYILNDMYPGLKSIIVRDTFDQLELSVIKQFDDEFQNLGMYKYYDSKRKAEFNNGSVIYFRAFNYDTDILSSEYDVIACCQVEDLPKELFLQFFGRLSGRILPKPLLLVEGNPASGFIKERYKDVQPEELKKAGIFAIVDGKTSDNPYITADYIARVRANYPDWWSARYLDSEWNNIDEMVYSEFRESRNVIGPIDLKYIGSFRQRGAFDYGWRNPAAMIWAYVDYEGDIVIYDEWMKNQTLDKDISDISKRHNQPKGRVPFVADYSIKGLVSGKTGRNKWDDLTSEGMMLIECSKDELNNITLTNSMFKQGRLKITRNCVETIKQICNWKWKEQKLGSPKNAPEEPVDKDNHLCDCVNYLIGNLEGTATEDPKKEAYKKTLEYANIRKTNHNSVQLVS